MDERCDRNELRERALAGEPLDFDERAAWRQHLATCSPCRGQASVDAGLRRVLSAAPPPPVPAGFVERFERRRAAAGSLSRRLLLRAYWVGFATVSIRVLMDIDWTRLQAWLPALGVAWLALLIASPLLALLGHSRPAPRPTQGGTLP